MLVETTAYKNLTLQMATSILILFEISVTYTSCGEHTELNYLICEILAFNFLFTKDAVRAIITILEIPYFSHHLICKIRDLPSYSSCFYD